MQSLEQMQLELESQYFDYLDSEGIQAWDYEVMGEEPNTVTLLTIKKQYDISHNEMAEVLGFRDVADFIRNELALEGIVQPDWVTQWTRELLEQDQRFDTGTEYGCRDISGAGSEII